MEKFFGFDEYLDAFFNYKASNIPTYILIGVLISCAVLLLVLPSKNALAKKIVKISLAVALFVLEVGGVLYRVLYHLHLYGDTIPLNWFQLISFHSCGIMVWLSVFTLMFSAFKKDNKVLQICYNILFGIAIYGALITFIFNSYLTLNRTIYHFVNLQTIVTHALLIIVPLYLIKTGDLTPRIKNVWHTLLGYVFIGSISLTASHLSAKNYSFALDNPIFKNFGLSLHSDWHFLMTFLVLSLAAVLLYGVVELVRFLINRKKPKAEKPVVHKNSFMYKILVCLIAFGIVMSSLLIVFIPAMFPTSPYINPAAVTCLIPGIYMLVIMFIAQDILPLVYADNLNFDINNSRKKHIALATVMTILALPAGIMFILQLNRSKKRL